MAGSKGTAHIHTATKSESKLKGNKENPTVTTLEKNSKTKGFLEKFSLAEDSKIKRSGLQTRP